MDLLLQGFATWFMTGVIWFVQLVHYPLMSRVGLEEFARYEAIHTRRTGWIVGPPMLIEAATALLVVLRPRADIPAGQAWLGLALLSAIWLSTAFLQVPQHRRLEQGFDAAAHARLVRSNWIRTTAWTGRSLLLFSWLIRSG